MVIRTKFSHLKDKNKPARYCITNRRVPFGSISQVRLINEQFTQPKIKTKVKRTAIRKFNITLNMSTNRQPGINFAIKSGCRNHSKDLKNKIADLAELSSDVKINDKNLLKPVNDKLHISTLEQQEVAYQNKSNSKATGETSGESAQKRSVPRVDSRRKSPRMSSQKQIQVVGGNRARKSPPTPPGHLSKPFFKDGKDTTTKQTVPQTTKRMALGLKKDIRSLGNVKRVSSNKERHLIGSTNQRGKVMTSDSDTTAQALITGNDQRSSRSFIPNPRKGSFHALQNKSGESVLNDNIGSPSYTGPIGRSGSIRFEDVCPKCPRSRSIGSATHRSSSIGRLSSPLKGRSAKSFVGQPNASPSTNYEVEISEPCLEVGPTSPQVKTKRRFRNRTMSPQVYRKFPRRQGMSSFVKDDKPIINRENSRKSVQCHIESIPGVKVKNKDLEDVNNRKIINKKTHQQTQTIMSMENETVVEETKGVKEIGTGSSPKGAEWLSPEKADGPPKLNHNTDIINVKLKELEKLIHLQKQLVDISPKHNLMNEMIDDTVSETPFFMNMELSQIASIKSSHKSALGLDIECTDELHSFQVIKPSRSECKESERESVGEKHRHSNMKRFKTKSTTKHRQKQVNQSNLLLSVSGETISPSESLKHVSQVASDSGEETSSQRQTTIYVNRGKANSRKTKFNKIVTVKEESPVSPKTQSVSSFETACPHIQNDSANDDDDTDSLVDEICNSCIRHAMRTPYKNLVPSHSPKITEADLTTGQIEDSRMPQSASDSTFTTTQVDIAATTSHTSNTALPLAVVAKSDSSLRNQLNNEGNLGRTQGYTQVFVANCAIFVALSVFGAVSLWQNYPTSEGFDNDNKPIEFKLTE